MDRQQAINELWRRGELDFLLHETQKKIKKQLHDMPGRVKPILCSRQLGKTTLLIIMAFEPCLKVSKSVVKYICPEQAQGENNIKQALEYILKTCPIDCKPEWIESKKHYVFPNGSLIQIRGTDNKRHEKLRGGKSVICIVDEAGFCNELGYVVNSILRPTIIHTKGYIYLVSTPSKSSNHEFIRKYILPAKASGKLIKYTINDNPLLTQHDIDEIALDYSLGVLDPEFLREYMCEISDDGAVKVLPEVNDKSLDGVICTDIKRPPFVDYYVSGDIGFKDLTAYLFGYWDFGVATLVVLDELILHGPTLEPTKSLMQHLAEGIRSKENQHFLDINNKVKVPYQRVMDNDLIVINDLNVTHGFTFLPTQKDNKDSAVNQLRQLINQGRLKIHERCKHLLYHMQYAEWDDRSTGLARKFKHIPNSHDNKIRGGHADALDSLIYMNRNIIKSHNPFPTDYDIPTGDNVFISPKREKASHEMQENVSKMLNIKPSQIVKNKIVRRTHLRK